METKTSSAAPDNKIDNGEFVEIQIPVPWGQISGKWWGSKSQQPILAIHGRQDNAGTFDNLAPLLTIYGFSLLCIDLPGHGFSSHIPPGQYYYMLWDGIRIIRRIVKYFNWEKVSILGHSLGGAIGFMYSASYPEEVEKLISIDTAGPYINTASKMIDLCGEAADKLLYYETLIPDQTPSYEYNEIVQITEKAYKGSINRKSCRILLRRGIKPVAGIQGQYVFTRDPRLKISNALAFITEEHVLAFASCIECEVLNIRADAGLFSDNIGFYNLVLDTIEKQAVKLERHVIKGTHHLHLNNAESVAEIIHHFLIS